jgi:aryl-alcohol dehydrogenase-like predicted oxidoreductase
VQCKAATPGGTARCAQRGAGANDRSSYRELAGLTVSSIGLGTYLGAEDEPTDSLYREAIRAAAAGGCNLAMPEALAQPTQTVAGQVMPLLQAADALGVQVITSAALLQTSLLGRLPASLTNAFDALRTDAQHCLQFARSAPGVTAALVGMKRRQHVAENLEVLQVPPLAETQLAALIGS